MNLPIDVVPGSKPLRFKWRQTIETGAGLRVVEYEGELSAPVEQAVEALVGIAKQLKIENAALKKASVVNIKLEDGPVTIVGKRPEVPTKKGK